MEAQVEAFVAALSRASRASKHTVENYRRDLMFLRRFLLERRVALRCDGEEVDVAAISADHIRQYLFELMKTAKRATVQRRLSAIKAFFRFREATAGQASPAQSIRSPRSERRLPAVLDHDDVRRLIEFDSDRQQPGALRDRAIMETLYSTGLRVSELVGLDWRDIDFELGMVMVRAGKGNKDRLVPIGEPALDSLQAWRRAMPIAWELDGPVVTNLRGARLTTLSVEKIAQWRMVQSGLTR